MQIFKYDGTIYPPGRSVKNKISIATNVFRLKKNERIPLLFRAKFAGVYPPPSVFSIIGVNAELDARSSRKLELILCLPRKLCSSFRERGLAS